MTEEFNSYEEFTLRYNEIPEIVALDVFKRICDWLSSGGSVSDEYVKSQLKYASRHIAKG